VILAAGQSSRMGRDKALLPWPPVPGGSNTAGTFLSEAIRTLSLVNDMVIVVAGKNIETLAPIVYANGGRIVENSAPERGQFSSLRIGLQEVLNHGRDTAMITLVDRPVVASSTLERLRNAYELAREKGKWAVVPEYGGTHGHPYIAGREMIEAFLRAPETGTARDVEHRNVQRIEYVPVADPFATTNVDTPEQYAALMGTAK
jgi:molybdenum cofactor cytidylyltransferase